MMIAKMLRIRITVKHNHNHKSYSLMDNISNKQQTSLIEESTKKKKKRVLIPIVHEQEKRIDLIMSKKIQISTDG